MQLAVSLESLQRLEAVCVDFMPLESAANLQDFDRIMQVLDQLMQCCRGLSLDAGVSSAQVQRSLVERLTLGEVRQRLLAEPSPVSIAAGDIEFF